MIVGTSYMNTYSLQRCRVEAMFRASQQNKTTENIPTNPALLGKMIYPPYNLLVAVAAIQSNRISCRLAVKNDRIALNVALAIKLLTIRQVFFKKRTDFCFVCISHIFLPNADDLRRVSETPQNDQTHS